MYFPLHSSKNLSYLELVCGQPRPTTVTTGTTTGSDCWIPTVGGTSIQGVCVFPFSYKGVTYTGCSTVDNNGYPWCYTSDNYKNDHMWGNCQGMTHYLQTRFEI